MRRSRAALAQLGDAECATQLRASCRQACVHGTPKEASRAVLSTLAGWARDEQRAAGPKTFHTAFELLIPRGLHKACLCVWELHVRRQGLQLGVDGYNTLIRATAARGDLVTVGRIWGEMKGFGVAPSRSTLHAVARCVAKAGRRDAALEGLLASRQVMAHDASTVAATLSHMTDAGEAAAYLASVDSAPPYPRAVVLALLHIPMRRGDAAEVEAMVRRYVSHPTEGVLEMNDPDVWTALLTAYTEAADWAGALLAHSRMTPAGVHPQPKHATVLLRCAAGEIEALMTRRGAAEDDPRVARVVSTAERVFRTHEITSRDAQPRLLTAMMRVYAAAMARDPALALYRWARRTGITLTEPFLQQARRVMRPADLGLPAAAA